ncbi:uncharacterized protein LOC143022899 [Oratosquilla oratoria]|uniref:uncharacterized protein LOC143022899 n=1 Tax=Oratosquilla oratoria TaxID=337810 RepID=UPI003F7742EE
MVARVPLILYLLPIIYYLLILLLVATTPASADNPLIMFARMLMGTDPSGPPRLLDSVEDDEEAHDDQSFED